MYVFGLYNQRDKEEIEDGFVYGVKMA